MAIPPKFDPLAVQEAGRRYSDVAKTRKALEESGRETVRFVEGPPTLNGSPHAGHLRGRIIKDLWYRYATLTGKRVDFYGGWDTQGLPVELQAEKELGVEGKNSIGDTVGVESLVAKCKEIVSRYEIEWREADHLMGMSMNHGRSYRTFTDGYIEREWQVLQKAYEAGILQDDYTVIGYCPGCQTSLSHAEVNQGYDTLTDPSLYYKVRMRDEDAYLVVWTTMPFTLVTDAMVGLHPDESYCTVHVPRYGEKWIVAEGRLAGFMEELGIEEYKVLAVRPGSEFEGKRYTHPLLHKIPELGRLASKGSYHTAVAEPFVDVNAGTGLVHLAPANGEEDIAIARRRNVEVFCPIDEQVRFTAEAGAYQNTFVRDADDAIVSDLTEAGSLVKIGRIRHKYPRCWRSKHPIVWLARRGWFYKLDRLGSRAVDAAGAVEYFFEAPKNRFLSIVGEKHPWCISRERYWGCPLPVWHCNACSAKTWCFSRAQIVDGAESLPDGPDFELHRPWIDRIRMRCSKCGGHDTEREQYVLDTWHNSGAAPFASMDDSSYDSMIPAPFFTEGIDQTRGWAYTLLVENVILGAAAPYDSFLFQGHVLDERGGKMSKSLGNVISARDLLENYPADLVRLYFMWKASPVEPLNFSVSEMTSRPYQILSTLYNLHRFFAQNAEYDKYDIRGNANRTRLPPLEPPDAWVLSRLQHTIRTVTEKIGGCRFHEAAKSIEDFMINSLSQSYVQSIRKQLWEDAPELQERRFAIYAVLSRCLKTLDILLHPFCPFSTEYLYRETFGAASSILLERWPVPDGSLVDDGLEDAFRSMEAILSAASAARARAKLKRRWPLKSALVVVPPGRREALLSLWDYLQFRMNVESLPKRINAADPAEGLELYLQMRRFGMPVVPTISLDRKRLGPRMKKQMGELSRIFARTEPMKIISSLEGGGGHTFALAGSDEITLSRSDFVIGYEPDGDHQCATKNGYTVFVSTVRDDAMIARWTLQDVARRLQNLRKESGFEPTAILEEASVLGLDDAAVRMVKSGGYDLASMVRVRRITFERSSAHDYHDVEIDGTPIKIAVR